MGTGQRYDGASFDALYRERPDPWGVRSSWYERRKLELVLASLPRERYGDALEVGCSVGATTERLAARCERLLAVDASAEAVRLAGDALGPLPGVRLQVATVPDELPAARFDLVVVGEVGYFLQPQALQELAGALPSRLRPGADLLAVHWRHDGDRLPVGGDDVHDVLHGTGLARVVHHVERDFRLDVWQAPGAADVTG